MGSHFTSHYNSCRGQVGCTYLWTAHNELLFATPTPTLERTTSETNLLQHILGSIVPIVQLLGSLMCECAYQPLILHHFLFTPTSGANAIFVTGIFHAQAITTVFRRDEAPMTTRASIDRGRSRRTVGDGIDVDGCRFSRRAIIV